MVRVLVREQHSVDNADALAQELLPQIGRRIDQQVALRQADERRAARTFVLRIGAAADFARAADRRHADARSCSEQDELPANISRQHVARHVANFSQSTKVPNPQIRRPIVAPQGMRTQIATTVLVNQFTKLWKMYLTRDLLGA